MKSNAHNIFSVIPFPLDASSNSSIRNDVSKDVPKTLSIEIYPFQPIVINQKMANPHFDFIINPIRRTT